MMKSIRTLVRQDREKYVIPRRVQDVIPIQEIWEDGIFLTGGRYAKTFRFTDINYQVASEPDKEKMFRGYSALINSLDCSATTKITNKMSQINFADLQSAVLSIGKAHRRGLTGSHGHFLNTGIADPVGVAAGQLLGVIGSRLQTGHRYSPVAAGGKGRAGNGLGTGSIRVEPDFPPVQILACVGDLRYRGNPA